MSLRKPPRGWKNESTEKRVEWLKQRTGVDYSETLCDEPKNLEGIIEQHIGYTTIPTAIASPLVVHGDYVSGEFSVPVCSLEGALVYSLTRGMMATAEHGIQTCHYFQKVSRAPVFYLKSEQQIKAFCNFVDKHYDDIQKSAEATSSYAKLVEIKKIILGLSVVLELYFQTANAAGQNMVTIAAEGAIAYIVAHFKIDKLYVESGLNSDKKASFRTLIGGRGHYVTARSTVKEKTIKRLLNTTGENLITGFQHMSTLNSLAGLMGMQLHVSNALAAIYLAMGQDIACTAENSMGIFNLEKAENGDGVSIMLTLPTLTIGTVGGGTRLKSQKRNLQIIGCDQGEHSSKKLAEIIAASTLCLEFSLFSSIVNGSFSDAHKKFGRNK